MLPPEYRPLDEFGALLVKPGGFEDSPNREAEVEVLLMERISPTEAEFLFKNGLVACRGGVVLLGTGLPVLSKDGWGLWRGVEIGVTEAVE
jgi:hypothetical protein